MSEQLITSIVTVITAIIGVAIIAVLVSRQSQTSSVLKAGGGAVSDILSTAVSPVTGTGSGLGRGFNVGGSGLTFSFGG